MTAPAPPGPSRTGGRFTGPRPDVTVVVPTHARPELVAVAAGTALGQTGVSLEVCVVDDGSPVPAADSLPADPRLRVLRHERPQGVARARNRGIAEARGEWVAFLDDDDAWAPDHLARLLDAAERQARSCFAYSAYLVTDLDRRPLRPHPAPAVHGLRRALVGGNVVGTPSCAMARARTLREVGGFCEELSVLADWDLFLRLAACVRAAASPAMTVAYAEHGGCMSMALDRMLAERDRMAARHLDLLRRERTGLGGPDFWAWVAERYAGAGRPLKAARLQLRAARMARDSHAAARALGMLAARRAWRPPAPPAPAVDARWLGALAGGRPAPAVAPGG